MSVVIKQRNLNIDFSSYGGLNYAVSFWEHRFRLVFSIFLASVTLHWHIYLTGASDPTKFAIFSSIMNDSPLEFNRNKSCSKSGDDKDDSSQSPPDKRSRNSSRNTRDRRDTDKSHDSDSNMSNSQDMLPAQNGPGLAAPSMWSSMMGKIN